MLFYLAKYIILGLLFLGLILTFFGYRGWRIDKHPTCGKCRYDLTGSNITETTVSELKGKTCPECGTAVGQKEWAEDTCQPAIIGNRKYYSQMKYIGFFCLFFSITPVLLYKSDIDWQSKKSNTLLVQEIKNPVYSPNFDAAHAELIKRINNKTFNKQDIPELIDTLLHFANDPSIPWQDKWGTIIMDQFLAGNLNKKQKEQWALAIRTHWWLSMPTVVSPESWNDMQIWVHDFVPEGRTVRGLDSEYKGTHTLYDNTNQVWATVRIDGKEAGTALNWMSAGGAGGGAHYRIQMQKDKNISEIFEEHGYGEHEITFDFDITVTPHKSVLGFNTKFTSGPYKIQFVKNNAKAKLLTDETKRAHLQNSLRPVSSMKLTDLIMQESPRAPLAPQTIRHQPVHELDQWHGNRYNDQYSIKKNEQYFVNFVVTGDTNERNNYWNSPDNFAIISLSENLDGPFCYQIILRLNGIEYPQDKYIRKLKNGHDILRVIKRSFSDYCEDNAWRHPNRQPGTGRWVWKNRDLFRLPPEAQGTRGEVILRPAPEYAMTYMHMPEILDGELIIENVYFIRLSNEQIKNADEKKIDLTKQANQLLVEHGEFKSLQELNQYIKQVTAESESEE
ncbi:hypothetical protein JD969_13600 [Planctomycetota bacterium]|nr:hypothetical protein JD969_13600 [Planctomycetota bacterium]